MAENGEFNLEETLIRLVETTGRIDEKVDALAGPHGRVTALEKSNSRQWWFTVAVAPVLTVLHGLARHFKLDV